MFRAAVFTEVLLAGWFAFLGIITLLDTASAASEDAPARSVGAAFGAVMVACAVLVLLALRRWTTTNRRRPVFLANALAAAMVPTLVTPWLLYDPTSASMPGVVILVAAVVGGAFVAATPRGSSHG